MTSLFKLLDSGELVVKYALPDAAPVTGET